MGHCNTQRAGSPPASLCCQVGSLFTVLAYFQAIDHDPDDVPRFRFPLQALEDEAWCEQASRRLKAVVGVGGDAWDQAVQILQHEGLHYVRQQAPVLPEMYGLITAIRESLRSYFRLQGSVY